MTFRPKRLILLAALLSCVGAAPAFAQAAVSSHEDHGIGVGAEVGLIRSTLHSARDIADFASRTGTLVGLWVGGNKNGVVGFTGEFLYARKKTGAGTEEVTLDALEIPAVFHINVGSRSRNGVGGYALVGPVFTINVRKKLKSGLTGDNFSSADVGLMGGAGIEAYRVGFEVRGNWGFKTVTDSNSGVFQDAKTRSIEVLLKVRFN